jgi:hypothetical protein
VNCGRRTVVKSIDGAFHRFQFVVVFRVVVCCRGSFFGGVCQFQIVNGCCRSMSHQSQSRINLSTVAHDQSVPADRRTDSLTGGQI